MRRLRDVIFSIFEETSLRNNLSRDLCLSRQTRAYGTQILTNEIPPTGGLRIHTPDHLTLVDADRSGGIAYLAHCWHFLARNRDEGTPRISLFYIFLSPSDSASSRHRTLWDFVTGKARADCGDRLQAHFAACGRPPGLDPHARISGTVLEQCKAQLRHQGILETFEERLAGNLTHENLDAPFLAQNVISRDNTRALSSTTTRWEA